MAGKPNKFSRFWQELKRRNVHRLMAVYGGTAYVIFEASTMIFPRWGLPDWSIDLALYLLIIGAATTFIIGWVYDITPEGVRKTKPIDEIRKDEKPSTPNSWRIATYVSFVIIIGLIALNLLGGRNKVRIDESLAKSIAVLPFHNLSGDSSQDFICLGLTDEIIGHLYKVESFDEVRSYTSVLNYRDHNRNIPLISEELDVNYILEGAYKRMGDELKITAQLIEAKSDKHIWLKDYNLPYEEIIGIPGEIAFQIADHLKAFLTVSETEIIKRIPTQNMEAYETLKQAEYIVNSEGGSTLSQAFDTVLNVIKIDPEYADAYAWAGHFTLWKGAYAGQIEIQYAALDAIPYFEKALELDQNNGWAHSGKGNVHEWARWDYVNAEKDYLKAIELEPNNPFMYIWPAEFYLKMQQLDSLWMIINKAPEKNRLSEYVRLGHILSGNTKAAYSAITSASDIEQEYRWIGIDYLWLGEYDSAMFFFESAMHVKIPDMSTPRFQACMALAFEKTDHPQEAQTIINHLIAKCDTTSVGSPAYFLGWYYSGIGEKDSAFYWLEQAFENRSPEFPWLKIDPAFESIRDDPRYWNLYESTGHKAYDDYMASRNK